MSDHDTHVLLRGGPAEGLPLRLRIHPVANNEITIKLPFGNRYEHFEQTTETVSFEGSELRVAVWSRRTFVAE